MTVWSRTRERLQKRLSLIARTNSEQDQSTGPDDDHEAYDEDDWFAGSYEGDFTTTTRNNLAINGRNIIQNTIGYTQYEFNIENVPHMYVAQ